MSSQRTGLLGGFRMLGFATLALLCGLVAVAGGLFAIVSFIEAVGTDLWTGRDVLGIRDPNIGMLGVLLGFAVAYTAGHATLRCSDAAGIT